MRHTCIFRTVDGDVAVTIAGTPCIVSSVIDTKIICETGAHSPSQKAKVKVEIDQNGIALEVCYIYCSIR